MSRQKELLAHLLDAFPPRIFQGNMAVRDCAACTALREALGAATWWAIPAEVIREHGGDLPLLTNEAYLAFLPAWLREAVLEPKGELARRVMQNLREAKVAPHFTRQQSYAVIQATKWIAEQNRLGGDPASIDAAVEIEQAWGPT